MAGHAHFEVYPQHFNPTPYPEGKRTEWRWRLKSANGEIVASGEGFTRPEDAERACTDVAETVGRVEWQGPDGDDVCVERVDS